MIFSSDSAHERINERKHAREGRISLKTGPFVFPFVYTPAESMLPVVVLHHGLFGTGDLKVGPLKFSYFRKIDRAIADRGHPLIVTRVHPSSSVENRARQLKE